MHLAQSVPLLTAAVLVAAAAPAFADGDVTATLGPRGKLRIVGDAGANALDLVAGSRAASIRVSGRNGTTVNGEAVADFTGVKQLFLDMGDGADDVVVDGVRLKRIFKALLGDGDDSLRLLSVRVRGRTVMKGGPGHDLITVENNCRFHRRFRVKGDEGDDSFRAFGAWFFQPSRVVMGDGDDQVLMQGIAAGGDSKFDIFTGIGNDSVDLHECHFAGDVRVHTVRGNDFVRFSDTIFDDNVQLSTGLDFDEVEVEYSTFAKKITVIGGSGGATVIFRKNVFKDDDEDAKFFYWFVVFTHKC